MISTPLHDAARLDRTRTLNVLIASGADIEARNDMGATPLMQAAYDGQISVVEMLLKAKVNVNVQDKNGNTALHLAAYNGHAAVVKVLLKAGADTALLNRKKQSAYQVAVAAKRKECELLLAPQTVVSPPPAKTPASATQKVEATAGESEKNKKNASDNLKS